MPDKPTTQDSRSSRQVIITMFDDGDVEIEIDDGVTAFALYGICGMLTLQGNVKMAQAMQRQNIGGIVVPGRGS